MLRAHAPGSPDHRRSPRGRGRRSPGRAEADHGVVGLRGRVSRGPVRAQRQLERLVEPVGAQRAVLAALCVAHAADRGQISERGHGRRRRERGRGDRDHEHEERSAPRRTPAGHDRPKVACRGVPVKDAPRSTGRLGLRALVEGEDARRHRDPGQGPAAEVADLDVRRVVQDALEVEHLPVGQGAVGRQDPRVARLGAADADVDRRATSVREPRQRLRSWSVPAILLWSLSSDACGLSRARRDTCSSRPRPAAGPCHVRR